MDNFLHNIDWAIAMRTDILTPVFKGFTLLGYSSFLLALIAVGYWAWDKKIFSRAGLWLVLSALLNGFLKDFFQDPRPDVMYQLDAAFGKSFGFPSGHAHIAIVVWFWIALEAGKKWLWVVSSVIVTGICFSRLYLGVHDVEDILGGIGFGLISLVIFKFITGDRFIWWEKVHPLLQIISIGAVVLMLFIFWPQKKVPGKLIAYALFLVAFWSGILYERKKIRFVLKQDIRRCIASVFIGIVLLFLVRWGSGQIADVAEKWQLAVKIFEAILTAIIITFFAPLLFNFLHLADANNDN